MRTFAPLKGFLLSAAVFGPTQEHGFQCGGGCGISPQFAKLSAHQHRPPDQVMRERDSPASRGRDTLAEGGREITECRSHRHTALQSPGKDSSEGHRDREGVAKKKTARVRPHQCWAAD